MGTNTRPARRSYRTNTQSVPTQKATTERSCHVAILPLFCLLHKAVVILPTPSSLSVPTVAGTRSTHTATQPDSFLFFVGSCLQGNL